MMNVGLAVMGLLLLAGCSTGPDLSHLPATVEASGMVLLDGSPLAGATVVLVPKEGEHAASGITDNNGKFQLKAFEGKDGAVPGSYMVQITKTVEVTVAAPAAEGQEGDGEHAAGGAQGYENALPQKYASPATSGFNVDIPESGITDIKFELVSSP